MNIVFFSNSFWSIYNFRKNLIKFFIKKGFTVYAIAPTDSSAHKLKKIKCRVIPIHKLDRSINIINFFKSLVEVFFIIKKINPKFLLSFTIKPNLIAGIIRKYLKINTIAMITGLGYIFTDKNFLSYPLKIIYRICFKEIDYIIFQNKDDYKFFKKKKILKKNYEFTAGSGVDIQKYNFIKIKNKKKINFLMVSRNLKEKGIFEFINAIKIIREKYEISKYMEFTHIGAINRPYDKTFIPISLFKKWEKEKIIKFVSQKNDIREYIKQAHCLILPTYREGLPRSILEGFSTGRPAIISRVVGTKGLIENNKNGYYCNAKDPNSLVTKILKFYNLSFQEKIKMGFNSRKFVENKYNEFLVIDKYWHILKKMSSSN